MSTNGTATIITACSACGKHGSDLPRCGRCKQANYCNRVCQANAWSLHKDECERLTKNHLRYSQLAVMSQVVNDLQRIIMRDLSLEHPPEALAKATEVVLKDGEYQEDDIVSAFIYRGPFPPLNLERTVEQIARIWNENRTSGDSKKVCDFAPIQHEGLHMMRIPISAVPAPQRPPENDMAWQLPSRKFLVAAEAKGFDSVWRAFSVTRVLETRELSERSRTAKTVIERAILRTASGFFK